MSKRKETKEQRMARVARLKALYEADRIDEELFPTDAELDQLVEDIASGTSEPERRLEELLKERKGG